MADNTSVATVQEMLDRLEARCNENPGCLKRILNLLVKKDDGFVIQPQNPRYEDERVGFTVDATIAEIAESKREPLLTVVDKDKAVVDRDKVFDELSNEESNCFDNPTKALLGDDQTKSLLKFFQDKTLNSATCEDFIKGLPISSSVQGVMLKSLMVATEVGSDDIKVFDGMLVKNREVQDDEVVVVNVDDSTQRRVLETEILEATDFGAGVTDPNRSKVLISEWGQSVGRGISLVNSNRRCDDQNKGMIHNDNLLIMEYRNEVVEVSDPFRFRLLLMGMNMIPYSRSMGSNDATLNLGINSMKSSLNWHCNIITVRHEIDLVAYVFLKGLCLQGDLDFAMEFFNKMIYNSLIPTSCSFNWLIHRFYHMEEDLKHDSTATNEAVQVDADYKSAFYTLDVAERKRIQLEIHFCILRYTMQLTIVSFEANDSTSSGRIEAHYLLARLGKLFHLLEVDYIGDLMNELVTSKGCCCGIFTFKVMMSNPNVWNVDLQDYFVQPYNLVLHYMPEKDQATIQLLSQWFNLNSENVIWGNYSITNFQFLNFDPWGQGSFEGRRNVIVGREANNGDMLTKMLSRMLDCMEELVYDVTVQDKISNEINSYKNVVGEVGRKIAVKDRDTLLPAEWWSTYGTGMLLFLMDVLSLFSSTNRDQYVNLNFLNTRMVTSFEKCPTPSCVVINPKGNKMMIVETNCCIQDALCMAKNLIRNNSIVYGGGSVEISCSIAIEAAADKYPEVEQYVIRAIADALDSFPMALAKNSGLQSIETLSALKSQQIKENNPHYGIEWCWD